MAETIMEGVILGVAILEEAIISEVTSTEVTTVGLAGTMAGITAFMEDFIRLPITAAIIHTHMARIVSFADAPFGRLTVTEFAASASVCNRMLQFQWLARTAGSPCIVWNGKWIASSKDFDRALTGFTDCAVKRTSSWIGLHSSLKLRAKTCAEHGNRASVTVIGGVRNELIIECQA